MHRQRMNQACPGGDVGLKIAQAEFAVCSKRDLETDTMRARPFLAFSAYF